MWIEANTLDGQRYYYHSETRETRWTKPHEAEDGLVELRRLVQKLTTKRDRVQAVAKWFQETGDVESLCAELKSVSPSASDTVDQMKELLACLYVMDAVFRLKSEAAKQFSAACGDLPARLVSQIGIIFEKDRHKIRAREVANSTVFLATVWKKKRCLVPKVLTNLEDALTPLRWLDTPARVDPPPPPPDDTAAAPVNSDAAAVDSAAAPVDTATSPVVSATAQVDTAAAPLDAAPASADSSRPHIDRSSARVDPPSVPIDSASALPIDTPALAPAPAQRKKLSRFSSKSSPPEGEVIQGGGKVLARSERGAILATDRGTCLLVGALLEPESEVTEPLKVTSTTAGEDWAFEVSMAPSSTKKSTRRDEQPKEEKDGCPKPGITVIGTVCTIRDFGCFVKVPGYSTDGLVSKFKLKSEVNLGDTLRLVVQPTKEVGKWAGVPVVDNSPFGKVISVLPYGYFVKCDDGREGLLHKNDSKGTKFQKGDRVRLKLLGLNAQQRCRFGLHDAPKKPVSNNAIVVDLVNQPPPPPPPPPPKTRPQSAVRKIVWSQRQAEKPAPKKRKPAATEPFEVKSFDEIIAEKKKLKTNNGSST